MGWMGYVAPAVIILWAVYTVIPDFFLHRLGIGSRKRQYTPGVAITFDDGPDPETTEKILDILEEHNAAAAFFITGENALRFPDLVREICRRGHRVGAHSRHHRYAWFRSPVATWRDWEECLSIIENLTGETVPWVRPPWGTFNLVTWLWIKFRKKQAVLWNVEGHDWQCRQSPEKITARVLEKIREGAIIVLHDAGGEKGATENTVKALPDICRRIAEEKKLPLVRLEFPQWPLWRRIIFVAWEKWEQFFARIYHVERINSTNFLRLSITDYHGPELFEEDGGLLARSGDKVGEIHFDSARLQGKENNVQKVAIRALRMAKASLPELAVYVAEKPEYKEIKVFLGLTLINRGVKGLGFQVQDMPKTGFTTAIGLLQKVIKWVYNPSSRTAAGRLSHEQPKLVWISKRQLFEKWLP